MKSYLSKNNLKKIASVGSAQASSQIINSLAGLLLVNILPKAELAYFTIISTLSLSLLNLTDFGLNNAIIAVSGKFKGIDNLNNIFGAVQKLRKKYVFVAVAYTSIAFAFFCQNGNLPFFYGICLVAITIIEYKVKLRTQFYDLYLRIYSHFKTINKTVFIYAFVRASVILCFAFFIKKAIIPILATGLGNMCIYLFLKNKYKKHFTTNVSNNAEIEKEIFRISKEQWFFILYSLFQYQITLFILSHFGSLDTIANYGALSRLAMLLQIINSTISIIVLPKFSRSETFAKTLNIYLIAITFIIFLSSTVLLFSIFYSKYFLLLIGSQYADLGAVLPFIVSSTLISNLAMMMLALNQSKGWLAKTWLMPILSITIQICSIKLLDLRRLEDVIIFNTLPSLVLITIQITNTIKGFNSDLVIQKALNEKN